MQDRNAKAVLFDLDGTLTDPKPGITRCIQHALTALGREAPGEEELLWCIGPPLQESFPRLLDSDEKALVDQAITHYRERFSTVGLFENELYPGVVEALQELRGAGLRTFVATSKPRVFALRIVEHFGLRLHVDEVYGSELDGTRTNKVELIEHLLAIEKLDLALSLMIGDRKHDLIGAHRNGLSAAGVGYGFGSREELMAESPAHYFASMDELRAAFA